MMTKFRNFVNKQIEAKMKKDFGKLKKVISVKQLNIQGKLQMETPSIFRRNKRTGRPSEILPDSKKNTGKS